MIVHGVHSVHPISVKFLREIEKQSALWKTVLNHAHRAHFPTTGVGLVGSQGCLRPTIAA